MFICWRMFNLVRGSQSIKEFMRTLVVRMYHCLAAVFCVWEIKNTISPQTIPLRMCDDQSPAASELRHSSLFACEIKWFLRVARRMGQVMSVSLQPDIAITGKFMWHQLEDKCIKHPEMDERGLLRRDFILQWFSFLLEFILRYLCLCVFVQLWNKFIFEVFSV